MVFTILLFAYRKPGTTPTHFRTHYENIHIPLVQSIVGPLFPISHTRTYIHRTEAPSSTIDIPSNGNSTQYPAIVLLGTQADFEYDAVSELKFEDEDAFKNFFKVVSEKGNKEIVERDEAMFLDKERMRAVVVGEKEVTGDE